MPRSAGVAPSQCCTKFTAIDSSEPSEAKLAAVTVNDPVSVLQPRPLPETSSPGPGPLNGYRVALAYVEPATRMSPEAGTKSALHQSPFAPLTPKPAYVRPPPP